MYHYVNNIDHPHKIYSTIKYGLADTGASVKYTRTDNLHENAHKQGNNVFVSSACDNKLTPKTARTLVLPQLTYELIEANLTPGLSYSSIISIGKLCDAGCKAIFYEQKVNITKKGRIILKGWI